MRVSRSHGAGRSRTAPRGFRRGWHRGKLWRSHLVPRSGGSESIALQRNSRRQPKTNGCLVRWAWTGRYKFKGNVKVKGARLKSRRPLRDQQQRPRQRRPAEAGRYRSKCKIKGD